MGDLRESFDILNADDSKRLVKRIVIAMNLGEAEEARPFERPGEDDFPSRFPVEVGRFGKAKSETDLGKAKAALGASWTAGSKFSFYVRLREDEEASLMFRRSTM